MEEVKKERGHYFTIRDKYYSHLVQALPQTEKVLFRYIAKYREKNTTILSSPYPDTGLIFNHLGEDMDIVFRCCNIPRDELRTAIKSIELPAGLEDKNSLNEDNAIFILLLRYYMTQKDRDKLNLVILYYAYYLYCFHWNRFFKPYGANAGVMRYTVNNLNGKYKLKQLGSIDGWLLHIITISLSTYEEKFKRFSDRDVDELISALSTRVRSAIHNIRAIYGENYAKKNTILESKAYIDNTTVAMQQDSFSSEVGSLALEFTNKFFSTRPSRKRIAMAAGVTKVSVNELQVTLDLLYDNAMVDEVKEFFSCLFTIYYNSLDIKDIRDVTIETKPFIDQMDGLFRKGNTKDPNVIKVKELLDMWLTKGSATFRGTKRPATLTDFRRSTYLYFIFYIVNL